MKQTTEFLQAGFASVNGYAEAKKDGRLDGNDIQFVIPLFFKWQTGIQDLTFPQDAAKATPQAIEAAFVTASQELTSSNMTANFKYGFTQAMKGYYTTYWLISNVSFQAGRLAALAEVKQKGATAVLAEAGL